jgi:hypothetical protein
MHTITTAATCQAALLWTPEFSGLIVLQKPAKLSNPETVKELEAEK